MSFLSLPYDMKKEIFDLVHAHDVHYRKRMSDNGGEDEYHHSSHQRWYGRCIRALSECNKELRGLALPLLAKSINFDNVPHSEIDDFFSSNFALHCQAVEIGEGQADPATQQAAARAGFSENPSSHAVLRVLSSLDKIQHLSEVRFNWSGATNMDKMFLLLERQHLRQLGGRMKPSLVHIRPWDLSSDDSGSDLDEDPPYDYQDRWDEAPSFSPSSYFAKGEMQGFVTAATRIKSWTLPEVICPDVIVAILSLTPHSVTTLELTPSKCKNGQVARAAAACTNLRSLTLRRKDGHGRALDDHWLSTAATIGHSIRTLSIELNNLDPTLFEFLRSCPNLTHLSLNATESSTFDPSSVRQVVSLPSLSTLDVNTYIDENAMSIPRLLHIPSLRTFHVALSSGAHNPLRFLEHLTDFVRPPAHPLLRTIVLTSTHSRTFTDEALARLEKLKNRLSERSPPIEVVDLSVPDPEVTDDPSAGDYGLPEASQPRVGRTGKQVPYDARFPTAAAQAAEVDRLLRYAVGARRRAARNGDEGAMRLLLGSMRKLALMERNERE